MVAQVDLNFKRDEFNTNTSKFRIIRRLGVHFEVSNNKKGVHCKIYITLVSFATSLQTAKEGKAVLSSHFCNARKPYWTERKEMAGVGPISQDWEPVVIRKKAPTAAARKDEKAVNAARRAGAEIETLRKGKPTEASFPLWLVQLKTFYWFV